MYCFIIQNFWDSILSPGNIISVLLQLTLFFRIAPTFANELFAAVFTVQKIFCRLFFLINLKEFSSRNKKKNMKNFFFFLLVRKFFYQDIFCLGRFFISVIFPANNFRQVSNHILIGLYTDINAWFKNLGGFWEDYVCQLSAEKLWSGLSYIKVAEIQPPGNSLRKLVSCLLDLLLLVGWLCTLGYLVAEV